MSTIKLKSSNSPGLVPAAGELALGELAINTYDGVVFVKKLVNGVESVVSIDGSSGTVDTTPNAFTLGTVTGADLSSYYTATIAVAGITIGANAPISITGGTYAVNGGAFTSAVGTVHLGDLVTVKALSSSSVSSSTTATLTIGGISSTFTVTTPATNAVDSTPSAFTFTSASTLNNNEVQLSDIIYVAGVSAATPIPVSITPGGEYRINGGNWVSTPGSVQLNDTVQVRGYSVASGVLPTVTILTINGVSAAFVINIIADTAPNAFSFPNVSAAPLYSVIVAGPINITGISAGTTASISISGSSAEWSTDGSNWLSNPGTVDLNSSIYVRMTSATSNNSALSTTIVIGGVSSTWTVTTAASGLDSIPDSFSFTSATNQVLGSTTTSDTITVSGISAGAAINVSITGGEYNINNGGWVSNANTVYLGDTITVRVVNSSSFLTATIATLNLGGLTGTFSSTTAGADTVPDAFSFTNLTNQPVNTTVVSNNITITGVSPGLAVPVTITGGSWRVNGGAYTTASGNVYLNDVINLQVQSPSGFSATNTVSVVIGGIPGTWSVGTGAADATPDAFSFTAVINQPISSSVVSNAVSVAGLSNGYAAAITISGGTYSINGGAFTASAGTVINGDSVRIQVNTSSSYATATSVTCFIGSANATFSATTTAADTSPDAFSFTAANNVNLSSVNTSNSITVAGVSPAVPVNITVSNGSYSVNGGAYTTANGVVYLNDNVTLHQTAASGYGSSNTTTLTIGGVTASYTTTTLAVDTTPDSFSFTNVSGQILNASNVSSNTITVLGVTAGVDVPVTVSGFAGWSKNGGAVTNVAGTVQLNDVVRMFISAGPGFNETRTGSISIGGVSASFAVTTAVGPSTTKSGSLPSGTDVYSYHVTFPVAYPTICTGVNASLTGGDGSGVSVDNITRFGFDVSAVSSGPYWDGGSWDATGY